MMTFHLQIQWLLPRSGKNHTFILNTIHLLYVTLTPNSALILKRTHIRMKENPEIIVQFYLKWRYILLYLDYKCKTLSFEGQDGNGLHLEKIGATFSSLTPLCRHVIEHYMNDHFYVSWFPPAVVKNFRDSICHRSCMIVMWMTYLI